MPQHGAVWFCDHAEVKSTEAKGGEALEACLADFGLAALIPNPNATKDITLL